MKRFSPILLILLLLVPLVTAPVLGAEAVVNVEVDGRAVVFEDQKPFVNAEDRTMVPLRAPMEALGATVVWNDTNATATITKGSTTVVFTVGQMNYLINGATQTMDTQAVLLQDRVLIPIKFAAQALGAVVSWNDETMTVVITSGPAVPDNIPPPVENNPPADNGQPASNGFDLQKVIAATGPGICSFEFAGLVKAETLGYPEMPYSLKGEATLAADSAVEARYLADLQPINPQPSNRTCAAFPYIELIAGPQADAEAMTTGYTAVEEDGHWIVTVKGATIPKSILDLFSNVYHGVYWKKLNADLKITVDKNTNKVLSIEAVNMKGIAVNELFGGQPIDLPSEGTGSVSYSY